MNLKDINFLPLDLPYASVDSQKIKSFMDHKGKRTNYYWTESINHPWNHVIIRNPIISPEQHEIPGSGWRPDFKKKFPEIVNLVEQFPYKNINNAYILEQIIEVDPHFDYASKNPNVQLEPATYRVTLLMEDFETFYICQENQIVHPNFPKETNSWVFSNKKYMHGSKLSKNNSRKVLLCVAGTLDEEKHWSLLEKSYKKYKNYAF
jgi:hypothetical protein